MLVNTSEKLSQLLGVESHERQLVSLVFLQAILVGIQNLFTRTAAFAIFLETLSATELPIIYFAAGIVIPLFGTGFSKYQKSHGDQHSYKVALTLTLFMLIAMRGLLEIDHFLESIVFALPILYLTCFRLLSVVLWGTANSVFTLRQSKRLYGLITTGDKFVTCICGLLITPLIVLIDTENLIIISIVAIALAGLNQIRILKAGSVSQGSKQEEPESQNQDDFIPEAESKTYLKYAKLVLALQGGLSALYFSIDNAFLTEVRHHFPTAADLAIFLGYTSSATALCSIILGAISARTISQRLGTMSMLQLTPQVVLVMGSLAMVLAFLLPETLWILAALCLIRVTERSLTPTVFNPSFHSLFHPLPKLMGSRYQNFSITISGPLAGAVVGAFLFFLNYLAQPSTAVYCILIVTTALMMLLIGQQTSKLYPQVLAHAVNSRRMDDIQFSGGDQQSLQLLENQLNSERPDEVVYSLNLLHQARPKRLREHYTQLLVHPSSSVRHTIIEIIAQDLKAEATPQLLDALGNEASPGVQATILRSIAKSDPEVSHDILLPYLQVGHARLLLTALVSLIKYGGLRSILAAGGRLQELEKSSVPDERAMAAQAIGDIQNPSFYHGLEKLLKDDHLLVRQTALEAAGELGAPQLLQPTLEALSEPQLESVALKALRQAGPDSLEALWDAYHQEEQSYRIQRHIIVLLGNMQNPKCNERLFNLLHSQSSELQEEILYALRASDFKAQTRHLELMDQRINQEGKKAIAMLQALETYSGATMQGAILLCETLQHEFEKIIERMLLIACWLTSTFPFRRMYESVLLEQTKDIAFYCELIEQTLPAQFAKRLIPLIEPLDRATRIQKLANIYNERLVDPLSNLTMMAQGEFSTRSPWLSVCAGRFMDELSRSGSPDTGTHSLHNLNLERKVERLKRVEFFSACSQAMLAECSHFFQTIELEPGETLVTKGLPQNSLYVVEIGELASEEEIFKEGSYFGEDALVGAELLHDAIHASTQCSVMALSREDFLLLLQHNLPLYISVLKGLVLQIKQATCTRKAQPAAQEQPLKPESSKSDSLIEQEMLMQNCGLFAGLNRATLQQLLIGSNIKKLEAGEALYEQDEAGTKLYLVASGEIELCLNDEVKLRLGRGGSFGKYSYLGSSVSTPTQARTSKPTTVIELDGDSVDGTLWSNRERIEMTVGYLYEQKQSLMPELTEFTWF